MAYSFPNLESSFPDSSVGKESPCNAGDPDSIPGSGRSPGEVIGYSLHYSWASLVAQLVKNPRAMWKTWVRSLGWKDPVEKGKATHSNILAWIIPWLYSPWGCKVSDTSEWFLHYILVIDFFNLIWETRLFQTHKFHSFSFFTVFLLFPYPVIKVNSLSQFCYYLKYLFQLHMSVLVYSNIGLHCVLKCIVYR